MLETTSKRTKQNDLKDKPAIYAQIGVREYFLFDPTCDYLDPALQGNRLADSGYSPIEPESDGSLISQELGLKLKLIDDELELFRLDNGERLLTGEEGLKIEAEASRVEAAARRVAEAEVKRLREELLKVQVNLPTDR